MLPSSSIISTACNLVRLFFNHHHHEHRNKGVNICDLPDECMCKILSLLPMNEIIRSRTVCKTWDSLIRRVDIWRSFSQQGWVCILTSRGYHKVSIQEWLTEDITTPFQGVPIGLPEEMSLAITATSYGLVCGFCFQPSHEFTYYIGNPVTRKWKTLPRLQSNPYDPRTGKIVVDRQTGDYRVFLFLWPARGMCYDMYCSRQCRWLRKPYGRTESVGEESCYPHASFCHGVSVYWSEEMFHIDFQRHVLKESFIAMYEPGSCSYKKLNVRFPWGVYSEVPGIIEYKGRWFLISLISTSISTAISCRIQAIRTRIEAALGIRLAPSYGLCWDNMELGLGVWEFQKRNLQWRHLSSISFESVLGKDVYSKMEKDFFMKKNALEGFPDCEYVYSGSGSVLLAKPMNDFGCIPVMMFDIDFQAWYVLDNNSRALCAFTPSMCINP